jgi:hypothetical protein
MLVDFSRITIADNTIARHRSFQLLCQLCALPAVRFLHQKISRNTPGRPSAPRHFIERKANR